MRKRELLEQRAELLAESAKHLEQLQAAGRELQGAELARHHELERSIQGIDAELEAIRRQEEEVKDRARNGGGANRFQGQARGEIFSNFGEQLAAVVEAARPGGRVDARLYQVEHLSASGLGETVGGDGGFLVEPAFVADLFRKVYDTAEVARRCRRLPVGANANGVSIPYVSETSRATGSRWGGVQAYWTSEGSTVTASKPKLDRLELKLGKLMALCYATDELLSDSRLLGEVVNTAFREELAFELDDAIVNGLGSGSPLGILNSDALVTASKESGQAATTFIYENAVAMWSRLWPRSRRNAAWFISTDVEPELYTMSLAVGTGGAPVFLPGGGASEAPYSTLFGRPIIPIEQCQTLGTTGDVILADMREYLLIDKGGLEGAQSAHVRFIYDEMTFRFTYRVNGQPIWASTLTPKNSSNTLSPYVVLETRE